VTERRFVFPFSRPAEETMKEASKCLESAERCETLAVEVHDASSSRLLQQVAEQWRKLARESGRHERLTWMQRPAPPQG
jgi:hypothetical protein